MKPLPWNNTLQLQLDDTYTRLKFLSRRKRDFMLENLAIDINDMFVFNKGEDSMVLIEGSPGIGKTTFCLNFANKWARERSAENSQLSINFELVLLLKCRDFEGDVMEAICNQLLPEDCDVEIRNNLMDFLKDLHNQEKVLLILDGLDELPTRSKCHVDKLLNRQILPFCFVLVTCRQERGISARKEFQFEIHFQIEGFTNKAASDFVMRYFENISPTNGQKLMAEIKENTLLQALLNNPLNLLLLCVVFEDSQGKLPSSRTELYQTIVCCFLRRYCAKHNLISHSDDRILQKQFEESTLALGELAWKSLLKDRHSFSEEELASLERRTDGLVARHIGLVFKEASVKKMNPSDEYYFLHKTFQEFLAASYLAHSLQKDDINIFRDYSLRFDDIVTKYWQVFLFAVGIVEQNDVLFRQVGEELSQNYDEWNWLQCSEEEATFFTECLKESGNSEDMACTLFSLIPLPQVIEINPDVDHYLENFVPILKVCQNFPQLEQPICLSITNANSLKDYEVKTITDVLEFSHHLENLVFSASEMTKMLADALFEGLSSCLSLRKLSLNVSHGMAPDQAYIIGKALAASKNLRTVEMAIGNDCNETWVSALEQGLTAKTQLRDVTLKIYGTMSQTNIQALIRLFTNKSLISLSIIIAGDMHDSVASAINEGLSTMTFLESFQLLTFGNLSYSGAISLEEACFQNQSLKTLKVVVCGEVPENWSTIASRLMSSKRASLSCDFQPSICHKVTEMQINHLGDHIFPSSRLLSGQSITLTLWGGLTCSGAKALDEVIRSSLISSLTLNIHGKLDNDVVHCLAEYKKQTKTLSSFKVNICCYLSEEEKSVFHDLPSNGQEFSFFSNFPQEESACISESSDSSDSYHLKSRSETSKVNLTSSSTSEDSALLRRLHNGLQNTVPLTTLSISINIDASLSGNSVTALATSLAENTSVKTFRLTINNYDDMRGDWGCCLGKAIERNTSVTTLKLTFNNFSDMSGDWAQGLADGLARNTSVTTHHLAINDFGNTSGDWAYILGDAYAKNTNLTSLHLKINNQSADSDDWLEGLCNSLPRSNSISKLHIYLNGQDVFLKNGSLRENLCKWLAKISSKTSLQLMITLFGECLDFSKEQFPESDVQQQTKEIH